MKPLFILLAFISTIGISNAQPSIGPKDSTEIVNTVFRFYNWYAGNYVKFQEFELYNGIKTKDQPPYKINWVGAEKYFSFIRTSVPQLSEGFITGLKKHFQQADSAFKVDVDGEIPYGFDYDWFTDSQEDPKWLLDELKKALRWELKNTGTVTEIKVWGINSYADKKEEVVVMCFTMNKQGGNWKIDHIGCPY